MIRFASPLTLCLAVTLMCGCPKAPTHQLGADADKDEVKAVAGHDHHHDHGPHGGHIIELGEHHGEVSFSTDRVLTLYILGADAKTAVPVADATAALHLHTGTEEKEYALKAAPLEGETDGKTSVFTVTGLPDSIKDIEDVKGEIILTIAGKSVTAELAHDHHDDHKHEETKK
ncbi:hypothetical protein [Planctomicrobium sp. SH664]|uniref:hypothetical protein n=1 Tax=Planctomicrobium sp. SH664 TaxID=3448125 RepID=UPI003F5C39E0